MRATVTALARRRETHLTAQQECVAERLALGCSITAAAAAHNAARPTVSGWLQHNLHFRAYYNQLRLDLWRESSQQLRGLAPAALKTIAETLYDPKANRWLRLRAAEIVIRAVGLADLAPPTERETSVDALRLQAAKERTELEMESLGYDSYLNREEAALR